MSVEKRSRLARRLLCNAMAVIAATAIFGFKAAERNPMTAAAPLEIASR